MSTVRPEPDVRNPIAQAIAPAAIGLLVAISKDPEAVAAVRTILGIAKSPPVPMKTTGLTKSELARAIGKSLSSVDRFDRDGAPHWYAGDQRRYDLAAYRDWLAGRGKRPTTTRRKSSTPVEDISDVIAANGLTEVVQ